MRHGTGSLMNGENRLRMYWQRIKHCPAWSYVLYIVMLGGVISTITSVTILAQHTPMISAYSSMSVPAMDLPPGIAFISFMNTFRPDNKKVWSLTLEPVHFDSYSIVKTGWNIAVSDDQVPEAFRHSAYIEKPRSTYDIAPMAEYLMTDKSGHRQNNLNDLHISEENKNISENEKKELKKKTSCPFDGGNEYRLKELGNALKLISLRRKDNYVVRNQPKKSGLSRTIGIKIKRAQPLTKNFAQRLWFESPKICLILSTFFTAFTNKDENTTTIFETNEADFLGMVGLLKEHGLTTEIQ